MLGARRPCIRARARVASISAWAARGPGPQARFFCTAGSSALSGRAPRTSFNMASSTVSGTGMRRMSCCAAINSGPVSTAVGFASAPLVVASSMARSAAASG